MSAAGSVFSVHVFEAVAEELPYVIFGSPQRRRLGSRRRWWRVWHHGAEQLPDEPAWSPRGQSDRAAGRQTRISSSGNLVMRCEHHTKGRQHHVEFVVRVWQR